MSKNIAFLKRVIDARTEKIEGHENILKKILCKKKLLVTDINKKI